MLILHTSDWHLGRALKGHSLIGEQKEALQQLLAIIKNRKPDVLIIAGDIYDRAIPPVEAVNLLNETLAELAENSKLKILIIAGNHDNPDRLGFGRALFARSQLYIIDKAGKDMQPLIFDDEYGAVQFIALPYVDPAVARFEFDCTREEIADHRAAVECYLRAVKEKLDPELRTVAVAHAFVIGGETTADSERDLAVGGSGGISRTLFDSFNYTALGHLHRRQIIGSDRMSYSGSLYKYSAAEEQHQKGVNLVELAADGSVSNEFIAVTPKRDVVRLKGYFADLMQNEGSEDYTEVTLLDDKPVDNVFARLKSKYPYLLNIQWAYQAHSTDAQVMHSSRLKPEEMLHEFWHANTGRDFTDEEQAVIGVMLENLKLCERGDGR